MVKHAGTAEKEQPILPPPPKKSYVLVYPFYLLAGIALGVTIGLVVVSFMYLQHYLHVFLWEFLPDAIDIQSSIYILIVCIIGGLLVGLCRKHLGDEPQPLDKLMKRFKTKEPLPGPDTVPAAFVLSLISLGFGAALGPEAALMGLTVGLGPLVSRGLRRFADKTGISSLKKPWSQLPMACAIGAGMMVFVILAMPMFSFDYEYFPYQFTITSQIILVSAGMGLVGFLFGNMFELCGKAVDRGFRSLRRKPIQSGLIGGIVLGGLGIISPLVMFSGQAGLADLFSTGQEMAGLFLLLIGIMKMIAVKVNTASGWKGGEFFPAMFASGAFGLGLSNLFPEIDPMLAIAAVMASSVFVIMDNIVIAIAITLLFLPVQLIIPIVIASMTAFLITKLVKSKKGKEG